MTLNFDSHIIDEITLDEHFNIMKSCIQCGTCSAVCPAGRFTPISARNLIRKAIAGVDSVLTDINLWYCSTCFNCLERCIREIPVTEIIFKLRNMAVRQGNMPDPLKSIIKNVMETGHAVPLGGPNSVWAKFRAAHKLSPIPPTIHSDPASLTEIQLLFDIIKFKQRIPYR